MYSEITKKLLKAIVTDDEKSINTVHLLNASKTMYFVHGVLLMQVDNSLSCVTQYYIQDINA